MSKLFHLIPVVLFSSLLMAADFVQSKHVEIDTAKANGKSAFIVSDIVIHNSVLNSKGEETVDHFLKNESAKAEAKHAELSKKDQ